MATGMHWMSGLNQDAGAEAASPLNAPLTPCKYYAMITSMLKLLARDLSQLAPG